VITATLTAAAARARPPYDLATPLSGSSRPSILRAPWHAVRLAAKVWSTNGPRKAPRNSYQVSLDLISNGAEYLLQDHRCLTSCIENGGAQGNVRRILDDFHRSASSLRGSCSKRGERRFPSSRRCCDKNQMYVVRSIA
jgi:hypothetical protein